MISRASRVVTVAAVAALCAGCGFAQHLLVPSATSGPPSAATAPASSIADPPAPAPVAQGSPGLGGTSDSPAAIAAAAGMSQDDVAVYCRQTGAFASMGTPEELSSQFYFAQAAKFLVDLKPHTPARLRSDVELLDTDYQAVGRQDRVFVQVKDEVDGAFGRVMSFRHSICDLS